MGRKFEEIVVQYPPADLCTYPEYRGKPYFSIKYEEDGELFVGFGTYKPEVLSQYIREYFIEARMTNQQWLAVISPDEWLRVIDWLYHEYGKGFADSETAIKEWLCDSRTDEEMIDYKKAFEVACELLNDHWLFGWDRDKIFEKMMEEDGVVSSRSYERFILENLDYLTNGGEAENEDRN